ncbi:MAG TPA: ribosome assembly factor SBDS [Candidatus Pacearchaeota archaeon]|jgi:ribosome maturation protein SDO1|nr:ribosome assembly factor SBDS [Candidatus Pacearchaeota archaeon]HJO14666.1 ribosome assembly factor SBDS [Candidatus Pacearchaeota archaeon]|tara:strand:+ start:123 stop:800 length:678 start_codon:yes stop_codon:yes gene_type:complete
MTDTIAKLRSGKLFFETMVDLDNAMKLRKGNDVSIGDVIRDNAVYTNLGKGMKAGSAELEQAFGTSEFEKVVEQIVKKGIIEVSQEFRDEALEARRKQVVDFLVRNAIDGQTGRPFTPDTLQNALKDAGVKIENKNVENQITRIVDSLKQVIPIKIETKKLKVIVPAMHTGKAYGLLTEYKEKEEWLSNGDLQITLNIPVGIQMEFYDKLNSVTHGSAITEEINE